MSGLAVEFEVVTAICAPSHDPYAKVCRQDGAPDPEPGNGNGGPWASTRAVASSHDDRGPALLREGGGALSCFQAQCRASMARRIRARASAPYTAMARSRSNVSKYWVTSPGWVTLTSADTSSTDTNLSS